MSTAHATSGRHPAYSLLCLGALGVVFGDIGTSPLYTLKECLAASGEHPTPADLYGIPSLIFWSLTMVVTVKYLLFMMRADNKGEGGIFALLALVPARLRSNGTTGIALLVVIGAATPRPRFRRSGAWSTRRSATASTA